MEVDQDALSTRGGLNPAPGDDLSNVILPSGAGGDEKLRGPIHNYARLFAWWQVVTILEEVIAKSLKEASAREQSLARRKSDATLLAKENCNCEAQHLRNLHKHGQRTTGEHTLESSASHASMVTAYPAKIPSNVRVRMFYTSLIALALQWGTTDPSILVTYLTPTVGLGCRSVSYFAYGCMATVAWLCLLTSVLLSNEVMLRYQTGILRIMGKGLASVNALWLITSSFLEIAGVYDNCWCNSVWLGRHGKGFMVLFKDASQLEHAAQRSWGEGLALILIVCVTGFAFFFFGSKKNKGD